MFAGHSLDTVRSTNICHTAGRRPAGTPAVRTMLPNTFFPRSPPRALRHLRLTAWQAARVLRLPAISTASAKNEGSSRSTASQALPLPLLGEDLFLASFLSPLYIWSLSPLPLPPQVSPFFGTVVERPARPTRTEKVVEAPVVTFLGDTGEAISGSVTDRGAVRSLPRTPSSLPAGDGNGWRGDFERIGTRTAVAAEGKVGWEVKRVVIIYFKRVISQLVVRLAKRQCCKG